MTTLYHARRVPGDSLKSELLPTEAPAQIRNGKMGQYLYATHRMAVASAQAGCLGMLLQAGCDLDARDIDGKTAAIWAVERGDAGCLEILLQAGCDVDAVGKDGRTAAMLAADFGHADCLAVLSAHSELRALRDIADFPKSTLARVRI